MTEVTEAHRAEARRRLEADGLFYNQFHIELLAQALAEPAWEPPADPDTEEAAEIAERYAPRMVTPFPPMRLEALKAMALATIKRGRELERNKP